MPDSITQISPKHRDSFYHKGCWIFELLWRALGTGHEYPRLARGTSKQSTELHVQGQISSSAATKKASETGISRIFYANVRWLRRPCPGPGPCVMVRPAAGRIGEWTGLQVDPSACFGVSLFRHEIVGYKDHGLVRKGVLHLR